MIRLITDSSSDHPDFSDVPYSIAPLSISTDERSYVDDEKLNIHEMLDYLEAYKGRSYTACPSVESWLQHFVPAAENYVVTMTSGLSGSFNSARAAVELFRQDHPETRIHIFDSLSTGPGMLLFLEKIKELTDRKLPFDEVVAAVENYRQRLHIYYCLHSLHNLCQNGRVSRVAAAAVGMLGIRILGTASTQGTIELLSKCRGDRNALTEMVHRLKEDGYAGGKFRISHVENPGLAEKLATLVRENWPTADIRIGPCSGLCSFYAERGGIIFSMEAN